MNRRDLLLAVSSAGGTLAVSPVRAASSLTPGGSCCVASFGAKGDAITDDTAAIQSAIDAVANPYGIPSTSLLLNEGVYRITSTLTCARRALRLMGEGVGVAFKSSGLGRGSALVWDGPPGRPMLSIFDSAHVDISDVLFLGNPTSKPSDGLFFEGGGGLGTNEYIRVSRCRIGTLPWSDVPAGATAIGNGIQFGGPNANNDQFAIRDCQFANCDIGLNLPNSQSIWGITENCCFLQCGKGVSTAAVHMMLNAQFWNCNVDVQTRSTAVLHARGWFSENSYLIFDVKDSSGLFVYGGKWTIQDEMQAAVCFAQASSLGTDLTINGVWVDYQISPQPPLRIRGVAAPYPYTVRITDCRGLSNRAAFDVKGSARRTRLVIESGGLSIRQMVRDGIGSSPFCDVGRLAVGNSDAAVSLGGVVTKIEVFDSSGRSLGFIPVHESMR